MPGGLPWKTLVQVAPQLGQMACQLLLAGLVTGAVAAEAKKHARMISARFGDASLWSIPTTFSQWIPESISDMDVATEVAPTTPPQRARSTLSAASPSPRTLSRWLTTGAPTSPPGFCRFGFRV